MSHKVHAIFFVNNIHIFTSYSKTDYALFHALGVEGRRQNSISLSYDIWCQFSKKLNDRVRHKFPEFIPLLKCIHGAIPKMHVHGHNVDCQINHSFTYELYSGMTCGEGIESAWSEQNHAAASTKEQNAGHRHDTLDDFNGYWNWTKLHRLCKFLSYIYPAILQGGIQVHICRHNVKNGPLCLRKRRPPSTASQKRYRGTCSRSGG